MKTCPSTIITSPEVIIAEYDAILGQCGRENFCDHLSHYTKMHYREISNEYIVQERRTLLVHELPIENGSSCQSPGLKIKTYFSRPLATRC